MTCINFKCLKSSLLFLNIIYILIGILLISLATYAKLAAVVTSIQLFGGIIACGIFLIIISSAGIYACQKHNQILLFFYIVILFLLFLVQFAVACACLSLTESMQRFLVEKGWNSSTTAKQDLMNSMNCCGLFSQQFNNISNPVCKKLPCCETVEGKNSRCCVGGSVEHNCACSDCWEKLKVSLSTAVKVTGGISLFFSFTEIIGVWLAFRYRNVRDPLVDPKSFL